MRPMKRYLIAALAVAFLSIVVASVVLSGLYGWNPIHLPFSPPNPSTGLSDRASYISAIASVSGAISSVFALIVGAIAVIAVIVSNQAESKSVEQLKLDIAS